MQHFLNLDKCTCGAYRYLAVREHKRSYEVYLIHHANSTTVRDQRKYSKLASIPKRKLNIHESRVNEIPQEKTIKLTFEQTMALRALVKELDVAKIDTEQPVEEELQISENLSR